MWDFRRSSDMRLEIGESVSILLLPFIFLVTEPERVFPFSGPVFFCPYPPGVGPAITKGMNADEAL